jgi:septin family protein
MDATHHTFSTNMERLRLTTKTRFYEGYRHARLLEMGIVGSDGAEQSLR